MENIYNTWTDYVEIIRLMIAGKESALLRRMKVPLEKKREDVKYYFY